MVLQYSETDTLTLVRTLHRGRISLSFWRKMQIILLWDDRTGTGPERLWSLPWRCSQAICLYSPSSAIGWTRVSPFVPLHPQPFCDSLEVDSENKEQPYQWYC